jgi:hypothetical protein
MSLYTYTFLDSIATIVGPGGSFNLAGQGAGSADEGISFDYKEDKGGMTVGPAGDGMHSLFGSRAGECTVMLLKNSPVNALLSAMYAAQQASAAAWGLNVIRCSNTTSNDVLLLTNAAFQKHTPVKYGKEGGSNEWKFQGIYLDIILGSGA